MKGIRFPLLLLLLLLSACSRNTESETDTAEELSGEYDEDVFAASEELILSGTFQEDVWAFGVRKLTYTGQTEDDVRIAGADVVTVDGAVKGDLHAVSLGGNILVTTNTVVQGSSLLEGNRRITLNGSFAGDVEVRAPRVVVDADVGGSLSVFSPEIQLLPGTVVRGDLINRNDQPLPLPQGVTVEGERRQVKVEPSELETQLQSWKWGLFAGQFFTAYLIGLLLIRILPRSSGMSVDLLLHHRGPSLLAGSIGLMGFGFAGYALFISILGAGVGLFLAMTGGLFFYAGKIPVALALGALILKQRDSMSTSRLALTYFLGLALLYIGFALPYIGFAVYISVSCFGMGSLLLTLRNSQSVYTIELPPKSNSDEPNP